MERLDDIIHKDLEYMFETFRDVTRDVLLVCGPHRKTVKASLQATEMDFAADKDPLNGYSLWLYYRAQTTDDEFEKALRQDAIIYVETQEFKIVDTFWDRGLRTLSLKRSKARGR